MKESSVHIQTILFGNSKQALQRSMDSLARAIELSRRGEKTVAQATLSYGDSSPEAVYSPEEIAQLQRDYEPFFSLRYRVFAFNSGTSRGHNLLFADCSADYLLIMNPDVIVSPRFFADMLAPFDRVYGGVGMVEARQTPVEHPKEYDALTGETSWVSGACALMPAQLFRELHGYDERSFFLYCDDVDLSFRARLLGYTLVYQPFSPVFHARRFAADGSLRHSAVEKYYTAEAALIMAHKWSNPALLKRLLREFSRSKEEAQERAVREFERRESGGLLCEPLDTEHKVATFVGYNYAMHRFAL